MNSIAELVFQKLDEFHLGSRHDQKKHGRKGEEAVEWGLHLVGKPIKLSKADLAKATLMLNAYFPLNWIVVDGKQVAGPYRTISLAKKALKAARGYSQSEKLDEFHLGSRHDQKKHGRDKDSISEASDFEIWRVIDDYKQLSHEAINSIMRHPRTGQAELIWRDKLIEDTKLMEEAFRRKGIYITLSGKKGQPGGVRLYRGISSEKFYNFVKHHGKRLQGKVISDKAFLSTTTNWDIANNAARYDGTPHVFLEITNLRGIRALRGRKDESEFILPPRLNLRIKKVTENSPRDRRGKLWSRGDAEYLVEAEAITSGKLAKVYEEDEIIWVELSPPFSDNYNYSEEELEYKYDPTQARAPKGSDIGGQWIATGESAAADVSGTVRLEEALNEAKQDPSDVKDSIVQALHKRLETNPAWKKFATEDNVNVILALYYKGALMHYEPSDMYSVNKKGIAGFPFYYKDPSKMMLALMIKQWAESSGDHKPLSLLMQKAAANEFKLDLGHLKEKIAAVGKLKGNAPEFKLASSPKFEAGMRMFHKTVYENTQAKLKSLGVTELVLYRGYNSSSSSQVLAGTVKIRAAIALNLNVGPNGVGIKFEEPYHGRGDIQSVAKGVTKLQPLSSFATNSDVAHDFGFGKDFTVVKVRVPASQVYSTALTGIGCSEENEVVLLGRKTKAVFYPGGVVDALSIRNNGIKVTETKAKVEWEANGIDKKLNTAIKEKKQIISISRYVRNERPLVVKDINKHIPDGLITESQRKKLQSAYDKNVTFAAEKDAIEREKRLKKWGSAFDKAAKAKQNKKWGEVLDLPTAPKAKPKASPKPKASSASSFKKKLIKGDLAMGDMAKKKALFKKIMAAKFKKVMEG